jgi:hypothetical protein
VRTPKNPGAGHQSLDFAEQFLIRYDANQIGLVEQRRTPSSFTDFFEKPWRNARKVTLKKAGTTSPCRNT